MTSRLLRIGRALLVGVLVVPGLAQARDHDRDHDRDGRRVRAEHRARYYALARRHVAIFSDVRINSFHRDYDDYDDDDGGYGRVYYIPYFGYYPYYGYHGRREGWRGCSLPPGLAKKYGCYAYYRDGYYYRPDGTIISVTIGAGR